MKYFLYNYTKFFIVFCFMLLLFPVLIALSTHYTPRFEKYIFGHIVYWGNSYERSLDYQDWIKNTKSPKGIILGSSTAYRNINTQVLSDETNINWFNLASSAQSPNVSLSLLKELVLKERPQYLLYDIYSEILHNSGQESAFDLINNSVFPLPLKINLFFIHPNFKLLEILIYRYFQSTLGGVVYRTESNNNGRYLLGGSTYSPDSELETMVNKNLKINKLELNDDLKELIKICNDHKIKLILNIAPIIGVRNHLVYSGSNVLNHENVSSNVEWFYDDHHMQGKGAIDYTRKIANEMRLKQLIITSNSHESIQENQ